MSKRTSDFGAAVGLSGTRVSGVPPKADAMNLTEGKSHAGYEHTP